MKIKNIKNVILSVFCSLFLFISIFTTIQAKEGNPINVYVFHGETCPHCKQELKYLDEISDKYNFTLKEYEVYYNKQNINLMNRFSKAYGVNFNAVPVVIIGYEYFLGFNEEKTERLIRQYGAQTEYKDPYNIVLEYEKTKKVDPLIKDNSEENKEKSPKFLNGKINLENVGPFVFGVILGLADGVNPCMFGVLIFLLTYLMSIGSKKKVLISGSIFVVTTFMFYYIVMYGMHNLMFNVSMFLPYISVLKIFVGCLAIIFAALEIKDFFFYGKGMSLKIPSFAKPIIETIGKKGTYFSAFLLAVFSSIVELPCTIGIPLTYIAATEKSMNIFSSLFIYNISFIIPLIIIILVVYKSSDKLKNGQNIGVTEEKYKKIMRLVAGVVLSIMGILLVLGKI